MKQKSIRTAFFAALGMMILILDGKTALEGATEGITLCIRTIIPSLFPFFVLSALVTTSLSGISAQFLQPLSTMCGVSPYHQGILISAFLGGYPVGAQSVGGSFRAGTLTKSEAEHMLAFCSNAGPAFIFGIIGPMFSSRWMSWALWLIHIASAVLVSLSMSASTQSIGCMEEKSMTVTQALRLSIQTVAYVCGWVILFRILIAFIKRWFLWILPVPIQVIVFGILELSNGCCELYLIQEESIRFIIASCLLAFGGLCVLMQTISVTGGLSLRYYYRGKVMQTMYSLIISWIVIRGLWYLFALIVPAFLYRSAKKRNNSSISVPVRV